MLKLSSHIICGQDAPDDGHVLVPVRPQVGVEGPEDVEQLVEDEAGVAGGQAAQWWPQLQVDNLAPAGVVGGHLVYSWDKSTLSSC